MTGSEGVVSGLQERETRDAASATLLLTDHQPVGMETPARIQVEVEHWVQREAESGCEGARLERGRFGAAQANQGEGKKLRGEQRARMHLLRL